jgi:hypothetical protein
VYSLEIACVLGLLEVRKILDVVDELFLIEVISVRDFM